MTGEIAAVKGCIDMPTTVSSAMLLQKIVYLLYGEY